MTEQEAEVLLTRLARIWEAGTGEGVSLHYEENFFSLEGKTGIDEAVSFDVEVKRGSVRCELIFDPCCFFVTDTNYDIRFCCYSKNQDEREAKEESYLGLRDEFRKRAWLSGCDIEATAHEKMDWIQGFSREEIQAWSLKI